MCTEESDSTIRKMLKSLCFNNGWSYGVFWRFHQRNSLLLTIQEAYYEEQMGGIIDDMLLQVHMLGGGIIGQAAFTKKHRWMFSESYETYSVGSNQDIFQDDYEFGRQFSSRIKTIVVISAGSGGVVQFGSTRKILESTEFVDQTKRMFKEIENSFPENVPSSSNSLDSLISPETSLFPGFKSVIGDQTVPFDSISIETPSISTFDELIQAVDCTMTDNHFFSEPLDIFSSPSSSNILQSSITTSFTEKYPDNTRVGLSELDSDVSPKKGLFSKLGIDELLDGLSGITSNAVSFGSGFEDRFAKRRRTDELAGFPCFVGTTGNSLKSDVADKCSVNVRQVKKEKKRKAKPGTRPRPKDRQMIQDRFVELRQLIPNGEKMNIDCLLDRTIKHMLFLQSVTVHADRVEQADKPKRDNNNGGGVTWACELGDQTMVCPLIVEDLSSHGQMLIEMLCEEQGFFLEIVDIIQEFGLNILKGLMEVRDSKIWARFIVEADKKRHVTRHEIFSALIQLIQVKASPNAVDLSDDQVSNVINERPNDLLNHNNRSVSLAETRAWMYKFVTK